MANKKFSERYATHKIGTSASVIYPVGRNDLIAVESIDTISFPDGDNTMRVTPVRDVIEDYFGRNPGKNLYNSSDPDIAQGFYVNNGSGNLSENSVHVTSGWIRVMPSTQYCLTINSSGRIAYYDKDKTFISGESPLTNPFTTPASCYYVRFSHDPTGTFEEYYASQQLELGATPTAYEPWRDVRVSLDGIQRIDTSHIEDEAVTTEKLEQDIQDTLEGIDAVDAAFEDMWTQDAINVVSAATNKAVDDGTLTNFTAWGRHYTKQNITFNALRISGFKRSGGNDPQYYCKYVRMIVKQQRTSTVALAISNLIEVDPTVAVHGEMDFILRDPVTLEPKTLTDADFTDPSGSYFIGIVFYNSTMGFCKDMAGPTTTGGAMDNWYVVPETGYTMAHYLTSGVNYLANWGSGANNSYRACFEHLYYDNYHSYKSLVQLTDFIEDGLVDTVEETVAEVAAVALSHFTGIEVVLPPKIYAVVGDTLQVFYASVIKAVNPYQFDIRATFSIANSAGRAKAYPRYFQYTPVSEDIGSRTLTIAVYNHANEVIATATTNIVVVDAPTNPATMKDILCLGDSLTAGGIWCHEAHRRLSINKEGWVTVSGDPTYNPIYGISNIKFLGKAALAPLGETYFQGTGGYNWGNYLELETSNPLWNASTNIDIVAYVEGCANYLSGESLNYLLILLSWNGKQPWQEDFTEDITDCKSLIDIFHTAYPDCKVKLMGIQMPCQRGGCGDDYGSAGGYSYAYAMKVTAMNYNKALMAVAAEATYSGFVEYIDVASQFDTENNMQASLAYVNTRSTVQEMRGDNGVHPETNGYYQIGDVAFRAIAAQL